MPSRRPKARRAKGTPHKPAHEPYMGFQPPSGPPHEGRRRHNPASVISAAGGGIGYDDGAEWAEGEPGEMGG